MQKMQQEKYIINNFKGEHFMSIKTKETDYSTKTIKAIAVAKRKKPCVQGQKANSNGKTHENFVQDTLTARGIYPIKYAEWERGEKDVPAWNNKGVLYKQVPFTKLWGLEGRSDFLLVTPNMPDIRIDARFQNVPGSVEEKCEYLLATAERAYNENYVIIVTDGLGVRPEIRKYMKARAAAVMHKTIKVFNRKEFIAWAKTNI